MKTKKAKLFNLLAWVFILIVLVTFVLTYPGLAKETGKALAKTTGYVIKKGISIVQNSDTAKETLNKTIEKTIEVLG
ncbi:MAG: hypothetical protein QF824_04585 [Candidatus Woesearchaeota archaeon]|jgi:hypothetical protein|nr:hypothetical protein [Candidatus Woesearchaeota archaeon]